MSSEKASDKGGRKPHQPLREPGSRQGLKRFKILVSPSATAIIGEAKTVRRKLEAAIINGESEEPQELILWQGRKEERVAALINRHVQTVYVEYFGAPHADPKKDQAMRTVALGIGARPDLPSGKEYVRRVKGIWKGLLPRERS